MFHDQSGTKGGRRFWLRPGNVPVVPPAQLSLGGYPAWQTTIVAGMFPASFFALLAVYWARLRWSFRLLRAGWRLSDRGKELIEPVLALLVDPAWPVACTAVRDAAHELGFRDPSSWLDFWHELKGDPRHRENIFRHMAALQRAERAYGRPLPSRDLLIELAYLGYTQHPDRILSHGPLTVQ